jgi:hypothetical protein
MMNTAAVKSLLAAVTLEQVMGVYSGRAGKCYCGCSGNHRYASAHLAAATKDRGYEIAKEEVNDRQVKKVLKIVQENFTYDHETCREGMQPFHIQEEVGKGFVTHFTVEMDERSYTIYLLPKN